MIYNQYESVMILRQDLTEEEMNKVCDRYVHIFDEASKKLEDKIDKERVSVEKMGKKKLAYEMKKNTEGWYLVFTFWLPSELIPELERVYRIDDNILKFITVRKVDEDSDDYATLSTSEARDDIVSLEDILKKTRRKVNKKNPDAKPTTRPLGQNHYDFLFGYTDELK